MPKKRPMRQAPTRHTQAAPLRFTNDEPRRTRWWCGQGFCLPVHGSRPPLERVSSTAQPRRDASCVRSWHAPAGIARGPRTACSSTPNGACQHHVWARIPANTPRSALPTAHRYLTRFQTQKDFPKRFWVSATNSTPPNGTSLTRPPRQSSGYPCWRCPRWHKQPHGGYAADTPATTRTRPQMPEGWATAR